MPSLVRIRLELRPAVHNKDSFFKSFLIPFFKERERAIKNLNLNYVRNQGNFHSQFLLNKFFEKINLSENGSGYWQLQ